MNIRNIMNICEEKIIIDFREWSTFPYLDYVHVAQEGLCRCAKEHPQRSLLSQR